MIIKKNLRLPHHNYSSNGAYFITICTSFKRKFVNESIKLIIEEEIRAITNRFKGVSIDYFVIMPDHIHLIVIFQESMITVPRLIQAFKSLSTLRIKRNGFLGKCFWQKNYYEHVIRSEYALMKIREYIMNNPQAMKIQIESFY